MTRLLDADEEFHRTLVPMANDLFNEAFAFARAIGTFGSRNYQSAVFHRYDSRFGLIVRTVKLMEETIGLTFVDRIPYVYNGASWSTNSPGGYTRLGGPKPHEVLTSLYSLTSMVNSDKDEFPVRRLLKAVTYVCLRNGHHAAVDYALDLIEYGYFPYGEYAAQCLAYILDAHAARDTLKWAHRRVPAIDTPKSGAAWADAPLRGRIRIRLEDCELYSQQVIDRLTTVTEETRASIGCDDFLANQTRLLQLAMCFQCLTEAAKHKRPPVTMRAFMSDLEEIKADAIAIVMAAASHGTGKSILSLGNAILTLAEGNGDNARKRIESSRAVAPRAWSATLGSERSDLAPEWKDFTYRIINPVAALCGCDLGQLPAKARYADLGAPPTEADTVTLAHVRLALAACDNPDQFAPAIEEYPWAGALRIQLAQNLLKSGRPEEALRHARIGLYLDTAAPRNWQLLADVLDKCGANAEADQARNIGHTLADCDQVLGETDPDILAADSNLATYEAAGRVTEAIPLLKWTLIDHERRLGQSHSETVAARNKLVVAYQAAGRVTEAIALLEQILIGCEQVLGETHPDTLAAWSNLVAAHKASPPAIPVLEQAIADCERILGETHPATITARSNLAAAHLTFYHAAEAIPLLQRTLIDRERVLGETHPDTLATRSDLAAAYSATRRPSDAIALLERTVTVCEQALGENHHETLAARNKLALAYHAAGRSSDAITLLERTVVDSEQMLGEAHPNTLACRSNLGIVYQEAGQVAQAIPLLERALADNERLLGEAPDTWRCRNSLADARMVRRSRTARARKIRQWRKQRKQT